MEEAAQNEEVGAEPSDAVDQVSETATNVRALLEQEARQLRRGRRLYVRLLLAYVVLACAFVVFMAPMIYHYVHGTSNRIDSNTRSEVQIREGLRPGGASPASAAPSAYLSQPGAIPFDWGPLLSNLPILLGIGFVGWFVLVGPPRRALRTQKRAAGNLAGLDDPEAVGPLAEALRIEDRPVRARAEAALVRLLPRLRASDAERLTNEQHACLNRTLKGRHTPLILAILKAYEQVGDGRDLPYVEALANEGEGSGRDMRVREAARECLPLLEVRARSQRAAQTLLRAASSPGTPDATLLRAAHGTPAGDEKVLLRPTVED